MAEVLTESFCERCGTRYTFESAKPRVKRLKGVKVLSRGLKNFVLSDDSSLDEAMAAARSDTEREVTSQQLDAFHKTFNFCMSCRQYTCANCWNEAEGTCLTCSPHLGHEIMPAPFPDLDPLGMTVALGAADAATSNGAGSNGAGSNGAGSNGTGHAAPIVDPGPWPTSDGWPTADAWPTSDLTSTDAVNESGRSGFSATDDDEIDVEARMAALTAIGSGQAATVEPEQPVETAAVVAEPVEADAVAEVAQPELVAEPVQTVDETVAEAEPERVAEAEAVAEAEPEPEPEPGPVMIADSVEADEDVAAEPVQAEAVAEPIRTIPTAAAPARGLTTDEVAAAAAAQTAALLTRFRPGQNLDAEIEAYERGQDQGAASVVELTVVEAGPEPVVASEQAIVAATEPEPERDSIEVAAVVAEAAVVARVVEVDEPEPIAAAPEVEPESQPVEATAEPEPVAASPEPEPEPVTAAPEPEPEPVAADHAADLAAAAALAAAASRPADVVAQPTWRIVAPDVEPTPTPTVAPTPVAPAPVASAPGTVSPAAGATTPEWPSSPQWPNQQPAAGLPFLGRLAQPTGGLESLWAESSREVASAAPAPGRAAPTAGVQPCISCGLSLSATARFCRRCGTSQHA